MIDPYLSGRCVAALSGLVGMFSRTGLCGREVILETLDVTTRFADRDAAAASQMRGFALRAEKLV
jgi:hypothetical protein